jgi:hypothetical protein
MTRAHWHVHSHLGNGYLCECESHPPLTASERDTALRWERDSWLDYIAQGPDPDTYRITGSIRSGSFTIDDTASMAWARYVESWQCTDPECFDGVDDE